MMYRMPYTALPKKAWAAISEDQKSYIDEFTFYADSPPDAWENGLVPRGKIFAHYAGQLIATWDGKVWS